MERFGAAASHCKSIKKNAELSSTLRSSILTAYNCGKPWKTLLKFLHYLILHAQLFITLLNDLTHAKICNRNPEKAIHVSL